MLDKPQPTERTPFSGFLGGECACGALFVLDENGNHGGEAILEVMTAGCGGDWDLAWSLTPDVDYLQIERGYDARAHHLSEPGDHYQPASKMHFFVRLKKQV